VIAPLKALPELGPAGERGGAIQRFAPLWRVVRSARGELGMMEVGSIGEVCGAWDA
jgi:hypothetical protein